MEYLGTTLFLTGGSDFHPEKLTAYEISYRGQATSRVLISVSTFYNSYEDLRSVEFDPKTFLPLHRGNLTGPGIGSCSNAASQIGGAPSIPSCCLAAGAASPPYSVHQPNHRKRRRPRAIQPT